MEVFLSISRKGKVIRWEGEGLGEWGEKKDDDTERRTLERREREGGSR